MQPYAESWQPPTLHSWKDPVRVLVVDDEDLIFASFQRHFAEERCELRHARTRTEALHLAQQWPPHVAFIDIILYGAPRGFGLARALKAHIPSIRIGLMTGHQHVISQRADAEERVGSGVAAKPLGHALLVEGLVRVRCGKDPFPTLLEEKHP